MASRWSVLYFLFVFALLWAIISMLRLIQTISVPVESILRAVFCMLYKHYPFTFSTVHTGLVPVCSEQHSNDACSVQTHCKVSTAVIPSPHRVFHKVTANRIRGKSDFDTFFYGLVSNTLKHFHPLK